MIKRKEKEQINKQYNEIKGSIRTIIEKISKIKVVNDDKALIRDELNIDSIMAMEIIATIDKEYDITIDERKIIKMQTIGEFINYIAKLLKRKE